MEGVRRSTARALALPSAARMAHRFSGFSDTHDGGGSFSGDGDSKGDGDGEGDRVNARVSYLANVAATVADNFLGRLGRRAAAGDAFGSLAVRCGREGAARVGACVAAAVYLSRCLADHGEDAPLLEIGADLFEVGW